MSCPFCELTAERIDEMTDEEASKVYHSTDPDSWCLMHLLCATHIRKMTGAMGRPLIKAIAAVKEY